MKVLVTGATGFLGGAIARALADGGADVRALVRPTSDRERLSGIAVEWVEGDVTEPHTLKGVCDGVDWIVHAAGMLGQAGVAESHYHRLHAGGTRNVLSEAVKADVRRLLVISSPGVLGPIWGEPAGEDAPPAPSNAYERSKASAEQVVERFVTEGLPVIVMRPEFVYGPGDTHVLGLFRAVQNGTFFFVGSGEHVCHPTFIGDAVDGAMLCLSKGRPGSVYHVAGPRPVTFRELAGAMANALGVPAPQVTVPKTLAWLGAAGLELVARVIGRTPPLSRAGVAFFGEDRRFSWQKARRDLGYCAQVELVDGVQRTVDWYRERELLKPTRAGGAA